MRLALLTFSFTDDRDTADGFLPDAGTWTRSGASAPSYEGDHESVHYTAALSDDEYAALAHEWSLDEDRAEPSLGAIADWGDGLPRHIGGGGVHLFEPLDWNIGGVTPVHEASLWISEPLEAVR